MADINKMDRTWLCSVLFMDIANYSSQSVDMQMKWKSRFNGYLAETIHDVPESERVILDTGDGAAVCFLGAPEAAMFAALQLCQFFIVDERAQEPGLRVRLGINLGPVKLVRDINGALNALGDGINAGQRIMSFAAANKILVSQSFFEVVSRLSDDYKLMFQLKGVEADGHVREHTVYHLTPPGSGKRDHAVANAAGQAVPPAAAPAGSAPASPAQHAPRNRSFLWLVAAGAALAVLLTASALHFYQSSGPANLKVGPDGQNQPSAPNPAPAARIAEPVPPAPVMSSAEKSKSAPSRGETPGARAGTASVASVRAENTPAPPLPFQPAPVAPASPDPAKLLQDGKTQFAGHNLPAARELFGKAADAGNTQAMVLLGTLYSEGLGGPKNDSDAVRMFRLAADLGYARGMYNLGLMYEAGRGVPAISDNQAADWYAKAVNRGDGDAAYRLGLMYEDGRGVPKDLSEARRLYTKAGTPEAKRRLATLPPQ
jgi:class 3 adenylate cyclase